jgi:hypothetical protein
MRRSTPLVTLLAGTALGVALLIASMMATPVAKSQFAAAATPSASAGTGGGTATNAVATSSPSPSASPSPAVPHGPGRADYTGLAKGGGG